MSRQGGRSTRVMGFLAVALLFGPAPTRAQRVAPAAEPIPPNTVVARLGIDPAVLDGVRTSGELIAALREHLVIDLAMPLEEPLGVALRGYAGDVSGGLAYRFVLGRLGLRVASSGTWPGLSYEMAVRESYGDDFPPDGDMWDEMETIDGEWDEEKAWADLVEVVDVGLPQSSRAFRQPAERGTLPLRVAEVLFVAGDDFEAEERVTGPLLWLQPQTSYQSAMMGGDEVAWETRIIVIRLAPRD